MGESGVEVKGMCVCVCVCENYSLIQPANIECTSNFVSNSVLNYKYV